MDGNLGSGCIYLPCVVRHIIPQVAVCYQLDVWPVPFHLQWWEAYVRAGVKIGSFRMMLHFSKRTPHPHTLTPPLKL